MNLNKIHNHFKVTIAVILFSSLVGPVHSADYFWVGGTGNWSDYINHWATTSGGSTFYSVVPTSSDNVFFDANSFSAAAEKVTINQSSGVQCLDMNWTGADANGAPELEATSGSWRLDVYGSFTLISNMDYDFRGELYFKATTTENITTAGHPFENSIYFEGSGGEWVLQDAVTFNPVSRGIYLNEGTLNTNSQYVKLGRMWRNASNPVTLTLGNSAIDLDAGTGTSWWYVNNLTLTAHTATINTEGTACNFYGYSHTYNVLNCNANNTMIIHNNTFDSLYVSSGKTLTLGIFNTQTIVSSFETGGSCTGGVVLQSSNSSWPGIISKASGTVTTDYVTMTNITATGGATFTANNCVDGGGNSGWTLNTYTPSSFYWIGNTGNWSNASNWSNTSGGSPLTCIPMGVDDVYFDVNSFNGAGQTVTIDVATALCNSMDWTGADANGAPVLAGSSGNSLKIGGSLTLINAMSITFAGVTYFTSVNAGNSITTAGQIFNGNLQFDGSGEWTLQDDISGFSTNWKYIYFNNGTLNTNGNDMTCGYFWSSTGNSRTLNLSSSTVNVYNFLYITTSASLTLNAGTSTINMTGSNTNFYGGNKAYYNVDFQGNTNNISNSNTFNSMTFNPGTTVKIYKATTQTTDNLSATGTSGNVINIMSSTAGNLATISMASGNLCGDYLNITDNTATGGATFKAQNSTDAGNNTGWVFGPCTGPPVPAFSGAPTSVCLGSSVTFTDASTNTPASWEWDIDDDGVVDYTTQNCTHTYSAAGTYSVELKVTNGLGEDSLTKINYIVVDGPVSTSDAGPDQTACSSTATLAGNDPASGSGIWTLTSGSAGISSPSSFNSGITSLVGACVFRWTISNGCGSSFDEVTITNSSPTTAAAGPDQNFCGSSTTTLAGNTPIVGTGTWTVISNTGIFTDDSSPTTVVTGLTIGATATLRWTIANGGCTSSTDDVDIVVVSPTSNVTFVVNSVNDVDDGTCDGTHCSLREAITAANANCGSDTIEFNIPGGGLKTITLTSLLPTLTNAAGLWIDGYTQPGSSANTNLTGTINAVPLIEIDGDGFGRGLVLGGRKNVVIGLIFKNNTGLGNAAIEITGDSNQVLGCFIGMDYLGTSSTGGVIEIGVLINAGAANKIGDGSALGRNLITGMKFASSYGGIYITGAGANYNTVMGNIIGLKKDGATIPTAVQRAGIVVQSRLNTIGGTSLGQGNIISGNTRGIELTSGVDSTTVLGNIIGTQSDGNSFVIGSSQGYGINIDDSPDNLIGGTVAGARNILSGNIISGIVIRYAASTGNKVIGNYIGMASDGISIVSGANQLQGVFINTSGSGNMIGGDQAGEGNLISGNVMGIWLSTGSDTNTIKGNIIGPQADGNTLVASNPQSTGIEISSSANIVGGSNVGSRNIISANDSRGIRLNSNSKNNKVAGNYIGLGADGINFITGSSQDYGVFISGSADSDTLGGYVAGEGNVISGNTSCGIYASSAPGGIYILGNIIGPQADGNSYISEDQTTGIYCSSPDMVIGEGVSSRNIISGNGQTGIRITGATSINISIKGNYIGIGQDGSSFLTGSSQSMGIFLSSVSGVAIGGSGAGEGNVISGNGNGIFPMGASDIDIQGNYIGLTADGTSIVTGSNQSSGIKMWGNNKNMNIGGFGSGEGNVISGSGVGINLQKDTDSNTVIQGNIIGLQADGNTLLASSPQSYGIISWVGYNTTIGGSVAGARNIISGNASGGIYVAGYSPSLEIKGNYIGLGADGINFVTGSSQDNGIWMKGASTEAEIGGSGANEGNVISGNTSRGLYIEDNAIGQLYGNTIGPQADGVSLVAGSTQSSGVFLNNSNNNTIGGATAGHRNIISGNTDIGINISGTSGSTVIKGNYIGIGSDGSTFIAGSSQEYGISIGIVAGGSNIIGGALAGEGNVISGNTVFGVYIRGTGANIMRGNIIGPQSDGNTVVSGNLQNTGINILTSTGNIIGGSAAGARNVISGNVEYGVRLIGTTFNDIWGNYIGSGINGSFITGSVQQYGLHLSGGSVDNRIGGWSMGKQNTVAHNFTDGITISDATSNNNLISRNLIYDPSGSMALAINLNYLGTGGNDEYQIPTIDSALATAIYGVALNAGDSIEVYKSDNNGINAIQYLGSSVVSVGLTWSLSGLSLSIGDMVLANVRDNSSKNTSQFEAAVVLSGGPLPIELISFEATEEPNATVLLEWSTLSETNNDYFTIERRKGGTDDFIWEKVVDVDGAGNSNQQLNYSVIDDSPYLGLSYYRLKQTDYDGQYEYSGVRAIWFDAPFEVQIYPNPASDVVYLNIGSEVMLQALAMNIYDVHGRLVQHHLFSEGDNRRKEISLEGLQAGVYYLKMSGPDIEYKSRDRHPSLNRTTYKLTIIR